MQKETTAKNTGSQSAAKLPAQIALELTDQMESLMQWQVTRVTNRIGCRSTAEDIVQQAMFNIWNTYVRKERAIHASAKAAFVATVETQVAIEMKRRKNLNAFLRTFSQRASQDSGAHCHMSCDEETLLSLQQALSGLHTSEREVVELRLTRASFDAIAALLHITPAAARQRMSRALTSLRRLINQVRLREQS